MGGHMQASEMLSQPQQCNTAKSSPRNEIYMISNQSNRNNPTALADHIRIKTMPRVYTIADRLQSVTTRNAPAYPSSTSPTVP